MTMAIIAVQIAVAQATVIVLQYYRLGAWASCHAIIVTIPQALLRHFVMRNR